MRHAGGGAGSKGLYAANVEEAKGFPITGGATWTSYSLDPVTVFYTVPSGIRRPISQGAAARRESIPSSV